MTHYQQLLERLPKETGNWLVTGVAGFIGSNLLETFPKLDQPVKTALQANLLATRTTDPAARNQVYNVAVSARTSLNQLFAALRGTLASNGIQYELEPSYRNFRAGDVRHSQADIGKAARLLGYAPASELTSDIRSAMPWYIRFLRARSVNL